MLESGHGKSSTFLLRPTCWVAGKVQRRRKWGGQTCDWWACRQPCKLGISLLGGQVPTCGFILRTAVPMRWLTTGSANLAFMLPSSNLGRQLGRGVAQSEMPAPRKDSFTSVSSQERHTLSEHHEQLGNSMWRPAIVILRSIGHERQVVLTFTLRNSHFAALVSHCLVVWGPRITCSRDETRHQHLRSRHLTPGTRTRRVSIMATTAQTICNKYLAPQGSRMTLSVGGKSHSQVHQMARITWRPCFSIVAASSWAI